MLSGVVPLLLAANVQDDPQHTVSGIMLLVWAYAIFWLLLLGFLGLGRTIRGYRPGYYDVPTSARRFIGVAYFGLMVVMVLGMWTADRPLEAFQF